MPSQPFNEALIKLCILLYQADGRITLPEQEYLDALESNIEWQSKQQLYDFHCIAIHQVREAIDQGKIRAFLTGLRSALVEDAKKVIAVAQGLALIDGKVAESEQDILDFLQYKLLAKALNQQAA